MNMKAFQVNELGVNCYLIWDDKSREAALIDCGAQAEYEWDAINIEMKGRNLMLKYALLTHCHFDHIMGLPFIHRTYGLCPIFHELDQRVYDAMPQMAAQFGISMPLPMPAPHRYVKDGDELTLGEETIKIIHTPGHTWGGVCYYAEKSGVLFSGDTLFRGSLGRTDLGGDMDEELNSIKKRILTLPGETLIYPGHGPSTTAAWEMQNNPYVRPFRKNYT